MTYIHHLSPWAPLRNPKQQYIPLQQHHFAEPLFESCFPKSHTKHFFVSTHLVCGEVTYIHHLSPWGPPQSPQNNNTYPCNNTILLSHFLSHAFLKVSFKTFFRLNPPRMWPGDVYSPSVTMGAPLRAPKHRYLPLQQHHFAEPFFEWLPLFS